MTEEAFYSTFDVSRALGVSTSTIKRWVDQGVLPAHRTAGGHRRLLRSDVLRLVREGNFPRLDLSRLDLPPCIDANETERLSSHLLDHLRAGHSSLIRSVIHGAYAAGLPLETLGDDVIAPAMHTLGDDWEAGRIDVMHEHRGTQACAGALYELRPALAANAAKDCPVAVGGNPEGDHGVLASLLIQMVLLDAGWEAINLGPHTPLSSFRVALDELQPRLVWLSASHITDPQKFLGEYQEFHTHAARAGVAVAVGGQAFEAGWREEMPGDFHGTCLTDLAAFARTLHPRPGLPRRGRPPSNRQPG